MIGQLWCRPHYGARALLEEEYAEVICSMLTVRAQVVEVPLRFDGNKLQPQLEAQLLRAGADPRWKRGQRDLRRRHDELCGDGKRWSSVVLVSGFHLTPFSDHHKCFPLVPL
jgi:hypothetical protein